MAGFQVLSFSRRKILGLKAFLVKKALASSVTNSGSRATLFFLKLFPWKVITYSLPNAWATLYLPASQNSSPVKFTLSPLPVHLFCAPEQGTDPEAVMHLGRIFPFWVPAWVGPRWVMIQIEMNIGAAQALGFDL